MSSDRSEPPQVKVSARYDAVTGAANGLTLIGGTGYWLIGEIDWPMLFALLIGSIPGIIIGSLLAPKLHERTIRIVLAATLAVVAVKLLTG